MHRIPIVPWCLPHLERVHPAFIVLGKVFAVDLIYLENMEHKHMIFLSCDVYGTTVLRYYSTTYQGITVQNSIICSPAAVFPILATRTCCAFSPYIFVVACPAVLQATRVGVSSKLHDENFASTLEL